MNRLSRQYNYRSHPPLSQPNLNKSSRYWDGTCQNPGSSSSHSCLHFLRRALLLLQKDCIFN